MPGQLRTTRPHVSVTQVWHLNLWPGVLQNSLAEPAHTTGDKPSKQRGSQGLTASELVNLPVVTLLPAKVVTSSHDAGCCQLFSSSCVYSCTAQHFGAFKMKGTFTSTSVACFLL